MVEGGTPQTGTISIKESHETTSDLLQDFKRGTNKRIPNSPLIFNLFHLKINLLCMSCNMYNSTELHNLKI